MRAASLRALAAASAGSRPAGAPPRCPSTASAPRLSRDIAPAALPRLAWVSPTAIWARPRHKPRSAAGADFQLDSSTSWAWKGRPSSIRRWARSSDCGAVRSRSSGVVGWPAAARSSGRPRPSLGLAFLGRPAWSRSRCAGVNAQVPGQPARNGAQGRSGQAFPHAESARRRRSGASGTARRRNRRSRGRSSA